MAVEIKRARQFGLHAFGYANDIGVFLHAVEQDSELVASEACHHVGRPQAFFQPPRCRDKQLVSGNMAQRIVDILEAVKVKEEQREEMRAFGLRAVN
jgi:hypothetical protein